MSQENRSIEILAPVGSWAALSAAFQGGADAVYFGVEQLNMRSHSAHNFILSDLPEIVRRAQAQRTRTYLTLNTVIFDHELKEARTIIDAAAAAGIDAIIASDPAILQYVPAKGMDLHISTQANISNIETVRFYARYADVMVLARELNLHQIKSICEIIRTEPITGPSGKPIRIEIFAHGALCMAISGKCYLSLHLMDSAANRGECLQVCRRSYTVEDTETGQRLEINNEYLMSPKDLWTIHFLNKILDAGVSILKIEGRARPAEYTKTVTCCYHEAVDACLNNTYTPERILDWQKRLGIVFNRGLWDGYYLGQKLGEWTQSYGSAATQRKVYLGKCKNYFKRPGVAEFILETPQTLRQGDTLLFIGPSTGVIEFQIRELYANNQPVNIANQGDDVTTPVPQLVRRMDKVFRLITNPEMKTGAV
jgi:putative protease